MKEILQSIVDKVFERVPFSKKEEQAKKEVGDKLIEKYEAGLTEGEELERGTQIIAGCKSLESTCEMVGVDAGQLPSEDEGSQLLKISDAKKIIKKAKRYIYLQGLSLTFAIGFILTIIFQFSWRTLLVYGIGVGICGGFLAFACIKKKRFLNSIHYKDLCFEATARKFFCNFHDRYAKKLLNTSMLVIAVLAYIIFAIAVSVMSSQYTLRDVGQQISYMSTVLQVMAYLLIKNFLCKQLTDTFFHEEQRALYQRHWLRVSLIGAGYFCVGMFIILILRNHLENVFNLFLGFTCIYFLLCGFYNLVVRKALVFQNITRNMKRITWVTVLCVSVLTYQVMSMNLYLTQPYINTISNVMDQEDQIDYDEDNGVYTITTEKENFKILQLTDIHLGGSYMSVTKDYQALAACYALINHTKPDLVVVTGDLVFPMGVMSFSLNNNAPIMQFANFMRNTGIPWAFTYGNHDTEAMATLDPTEFDSLMKSLSFKSSGNLLYPYVQPDIYGRSNQMIEIRNTDGSLKQALFLLDSNDYIPGSGTINEYDYIHDDQVEWYKKNVLALSEEEGYTIPSMLFFHIPLREYKEANDLYEAGSDEVTYYYGILGEKMIDKICCSKYESKLFSTAVELGSTKAMFCGHDHYNNQSLEYKGIRLTYGYSIDYLVMPGIEDDTEQRGATLITVDRKGEFHIDPVKLTDIQ